MRLEECRTFSTNKRGGPWWGGGAHRNRVNDLWGGWNYAAFVNIPTLSTRGRQTVSNLCLLSTVTTLTLDVWPTWWISQNPPASDADISKYHCFWSTNQLSFIMSVMFLPPCHTITVIVKIQWYLLVHWWPAVQYCACVPLKRKEGKEANVG